MLKQRIKRAVFSLLGKDPDSVVVSFLSGDPGLAARMVEEVRQIIPGRRHFTVGFGHADIALTPGSALGLAAQLRRALARYRIGMAPVLFDGDRSFTPLRRAAFLVAPGRVLAYNARLERHHLRLRTGIASALFLRGVPVHRIYVRPRWLAPWKRRNPEACQPKVLHGRPFANRRRVLVATPYVPYPLSHGGAVRMYHLLQESAREFDLILFAFTEGAEEEPGPLLEFCSAIVLVPKREHDEPRWSTLRPAETHEYFSRELLRAYEKTCREFRPDLRQVEYTALAQFPGDILVEHDVTFDLQEQIHGRARTLSTWWNLRRWKRFESAAVRRFRTVIVMSAKDAAILGEPPNVSVIPNGVGLDRFSPRPERPGANLLFIGSFRHAPNILAYRFFVGKVWPLLRKSRPDVRLTVVAGPDPMIYWRAATGTLAPEEDPHIRLLGFVRDVHPLYVEANVVVVPTLVSAGTNLKTLEAMAMERAVVSTPSGCAGLGLAHGESVWVADDPAGFAAGITRLLEDGGLRERIAAAARRVAEEQFDWKAIGEKQRDLYWSMLGGRLRVRPAAEADIPELDRIQRSAPEAVLWEPHGYLGYDCRVAELQGAVVGFIVVRNAGGVEGEVLSLIVDPAYRRRGIAAHLLNEVMRGSRMTWFLEVRESNWPARNLYRKFGFSDVSSRPKYYQDNGETAVVMRKQSC